MTTHPGDSAVQQAVALEVLSEIAKQLGIELEPRRIDMGGGVAIQVNGASPDNSVLVELNAHVGPLKGGQPHKLAADAFKLIWAGARLNSRRLVIGVVGDHADAYLRRPKAWLTAALRDHNVEIIHVPLPEDAVDTIVEAQKRQFR